MKLQLFVAFVIIIVNPANCVIRPITDSQGWDNELEKASHEFNLDVYVKQWMDECEKNNGSEAVNEIHDALPKFADCVTSKINIVNVSDEIKVASSKGTLDEVFAKYCNEITAIKECKTPLMSAMQVCLSEKALQDLEVFNSTIDEALDFMCFKGGERIAIFMSENGTDCFLSNVDTIATCLNESLPELKTAMTSMYSTNTSLFTEKNCRLENKMKACVIDSLKTCSDPTPANVIEGLIDSMIKRTPCYTSEANLLSQSFLLFWLTVAWKITTLFGF